MANAIQRYDFTRGIRYSTVVYEYVARTLRDASRHRPGEATVRRWDRRAANLAAHRMEQLAMAGQSVTFEEAARAAGVTEAAARRGNARLVLLDDQQTADPKAEAAFDRVLSPTAALLDLLGPRDRQVLELRYGLIGEPKTLEETAAILDTTRSTAHRWERDALRAARELLARDRTTTAAPRRRGAAVR